MFYIYVCVTFIVHGPQNLYPGWNFVQVTVKYNVNTSTHSLHKIGWCFGL